MAEAGLTASLPAGAGCPRGCPRQPPRGPSVAQQCCWEGQQSGTGRGSQRADGVLPLTMSVQWPNDWKRRRLCSHPAQLFDMLGRGVVFLQVYKYICITM